MQRAESERRSAPAPAAGHDQSQVLTGAASSGVAGVPGAPDIQHVGSSWSNQIVCNKSNVLNIFKIIKISR